MWSFSNARLFDQCQRAWAYKNHLANANATKNPQQREAYILSKLQTIWGWRGKIVDHVISSRVIPAIEKQWVLSPRKILEYARLVYDKQREFALLNRIREDGMSQTKAGDAFAALYAVEYGSGISPEELDHAWEEIERALQNFLAMRELLDELRRAEKLISQRSLTFSIFDAKARAVPDLIAFFRDASPLIVDWKVHGFGSRDSRSQLAVYALALSRSPAHQDFPSRAIPEPEEIRLIEAQLLTNTLRPYKLTAGDVESIESRIVASFVEMKLSEGDRTKAPVDPFDYPVTDYPETCESCRFRKMCWQEQVCQESKQMTLL
jgi:hypothetical protein